MRHVASGAEAAFAKQYSCRGMWLGTLMPGSLDRKIIVASGIAATVSTAAAATADLRLL
jgi:hypothetical protein